MENNKKVKVIAYSFIAAAVIVGILIVGALVIRPYDDGTLAPYSLSANLAYDGKVAATSAYELYVPKEGGLYRYSTSDETVEKIADGDIKYVNPADGAVYYVLDNQLVASDYLGFDKKVISGDKQVARMSVNGYWIYFTDIEGKIYKMRRDGSELRDISPEGCKVDSFSADNRHIVFLDGDALYAMKSDGKELEKLVENGVDHFCYTSDNIFYSTNGTVKMIYRYVAKYVEADRIPYEEIKADIYNYGYDEDGNGVIYYSDGASLKVRKLAKLGGYGEEDTAEENYTVVEDMPGIKAIYNAGYHLYIVNETGEMVKVEVDGSYVGIVTKVEIGE